MAVQRPKRRQGYQLRVYDPVRGALLAVLAVVLLGSAAAAIYWVGYKAADGITASERNELISLRSQVAYLSKRNQDLTDLAARLGRSGEIDREAAQRVQKSLNQMETRLTNLNEELAFYRSIVSPSSGEGGLHLQRFHLRHAASGNAYSFSLMLTQTLRGGGQARGSVSAEIEGRQDGKSRTLDIAKLSRVNMNFAFKYFQGFQGTFKLPVGFSPEKIVITVHPYSGNVARTEKTYTWEEALKGG